MIYTCKQDENFDPEILRQELVAAIGAEGWHLNTAGNTVEFVQDPTRFFVPEEFILHHFANGATRDHNKVILKQIAELEATQTPRRVREGGQWMADLDAKIAVLREGLK